MRLGLVLFIICVSPNVFAAFANYSSILFGEQAAGMGGAYVALNQDSGALAYYNPAGIADMKQSSVSAAVTVFKKFDTVYGRAADDIITAGMRSNQGFFQSIPASSSSIIKFDKFNTAITFLSPDHSTFSGEVYSDDFNTSLLTQVDESLWIGGSIGAPITLNDYVGMSLFYTARNFRRTATDRTLLSSGDVRIYSSEKQLTYNSIVAILGYQRLLGQRWRYGLSVQLPSLSIGGEGSYHASFIDTELDNQQSRSYSELETSSPTPGAIRTGVSFQYNPDLLFSLDLSLHGATKYTDFEPKEAADLIHHIAITDFAVGAEWRALPRIRIRSGLFTNFSSHPVPDPDLGYRQPASINQYGFSANISYTQNEYVNYTFGGYYTGGTGTSLQRINQVLTNVKTGEQIFTMLIGKSFYF